ncbi:uncharacterized protein LOC118945277 isoform X2 [Oncorhynchus mykiss]|uniref:uncharacterized protein LOC118945277 isoform X2 n=2 Tax=Oncorhynchus mykiss TaxID=8022 RepID=UPI001877F9BF|nr:uncharacterized protein LOC118945277 isoform X2 [Oncorhynchus mykiss]
MTEHWVVAGTVLESPWHTEIGRNITCRVILRWCPRQIWYLPLPCSWASPSPTAVWAGPAASVPCRQPDRGCTSRSQPGGGQTGARQGETRGWT